MVLTYTVIDIVIIFVAMIAAFVIGSADGLDANHVPFDLLLPAALTDELSGMLFAPAASVTAPVTAP